MILSVTSKKHYESNQPADEPRPNPYHLLPGKNIFSVKGKQRILDQMENYLHWLIIRRQRRTGRTRSGLTRRPSTISTGTRAAPFPPGRKTPLPLKMTP